MARYAMVHEESGIVVNVIQWDGDTATYTPPSGHVMVEDTEVIVGPGFRYDGTSFMPPPSGAVVVSE